MSRTLLVVILIIFVLIIIGGAAILFLSKQTSDTSSNPSQAPVAQEPDSYTSDSGKTFIARLKLVNLKSNGGKIIGTFSPVGNDRLTYSIILFDKNTYPNFFIIPSPDPETGDVIPDKLSDTNSIYDKVKIFQGKNVIGVFPLDPPPNNVSVLDCNSKLAKYLKEGKELNTCNPFMFNLSADDQNP